MLRPIVLYLILFLSASEASALMISQNLSQRVFLTDILDIKNSRYLEGRMYSRFPKTEKKLRLSSLLRRDPSNGLYSNEHFFIYTVQSNDSLRKIARQHETTVEFIKQRNRLDNDHLKSGQKLLIWNQPFTIEVNKAFNRLYLRSGNVLIKEYPVSTGKSVSQTPLGIFLIQSRYPYPTWFHKKVIVSGGSSDNFLGSRWLGFDKPQFGIHGTIFPGLIGQSVSGGCIRMKNEDVEEIYEFIPVGTTVKIN